MRNFAYIFDPSRLRLSRRGSLVSKRANISEIWNMPLESRWWPKSCPRQIRCRSLPITQRTGSNKIGPGKRAEEIS